MITANQLLRREQRIYRYSSALTGELEILAAMASEILGFEVVADLCGGAEIEFREVTEEGFVDDSTCIRMEDVISKLKRN